MARIDLDRIVAQCADDGLDAGITIRTELEPLAGPGAKVKPAVYAGGRFQQGRRWWGDGEDRRPVDVITIDNEPSQANRLEAALESLREQVGLPEVVLDLTSLEPLPPHVPRRLSGFRFPHRSADAYLRDAKRGNQDFLKDPIGKAIFAATMDQPDALFEWFPQALLYGFWQSHLGKKGSQAKLARSWTSEIIGLEPAATDVRSLGLKGDPLNLSIEDKVAYDAQWHERWSLSDKGSNLSDIGHGQVPVTGDDAALAGVSFRTIVQQSTVSFASLRRIRPSVGAPEGRALLVALGLLAHVVAFGRAFHLRSGCDLRPAVTEWTWVGAGGDEAVEPLARDEAVEVLRSAAQRAEDAGLPVGSRWPEPLVLEPRDNLREVIRKTFPEPEDG